MKTIVLSNGECYYIPQADSQFFKELAARMKWRLVGNTETVSSPKTWVDGLAGKWQDKRSTSQIISDIHTARTANSEVEL